MPVDLRSDTVTRPTPAMRRAMAAAEVGDDGFGEDPTVRRLEERYAELVGKEAALWTPSGTMANQIAQRVLARPATAIVAGRRQHVVAYEGGAGPRNHGAQYLTLDDTDGTLDPAEVALAVAAADHHQPEVSLVCVEDTHMPSGGRCWPLDRLEAVAAVGPPVHLDGARLWNAAAATGTTPARRAAPATTVMSCLSKGLGAPAGSVLAGPAGIIAEARRERARLGGQMRQIGILAAAGLHALDHHRDRLVEDHRRARRLAEAVAERWPGSGCVPGTVETNCVVFTHADPPALLAHLAGQGVLALTIAPGVVRLMTHLDVDDAGVERACRAIARAP